MSGSVLYILGRPAGAELQAGIEAQVARGAEVRVVLLPGAADAPPELHACRLEEGPVREGAGEGRGGVGAERLLELIFEADSVVVW
jgi:hypothetical protein